MFDENFQFGLFIVGKIRYYNTTSRKWKMWRPYKYFWKKLKLIKLLKRNCGQRRKKNYLRDKFERPPVDFRASKRKQFLSLGAFIIYFVYCVCKLRCIVRVPLCIFQMKIAWILPLIYSLRGIRLGFRNGVTNQASTCRLIRLLVPQESADRFNWRSKMTCA